MLVERSSSDAVKGGTWEPGVESNSPPSSNASKSCRPNLKALTTRASSDYGWEEADDVCDFRWFSGNRLPSSITEITIQPEKEVPKFFCFINHFQNFAGSGGPPAATSLPISKSRKKKL
ncbi:hypothetical protein EVAR_99625_1 [Eumeta japonica]|uniref:Uncharacterized protein n=1 Tax=Eumeta variegata TaxID=151549 RepID=A0A4C2A5H4_EUMVA|nr:hypothetical protein EVAR_99625_1 [Eumeta japonica]